METQIKTMIHQQQHSLLHHYRQPVMLVSSDKPVIRKKGAVKNTEGVSNLSYGK